MPAGPSEVLVSQMKRRILHYCPDLLADGEHGEDSACVLITASTKVAKANIEEIKNNY